MIFYKGVMADGCKVEAKMQKTILRHCSSCEKDVDAIAESDVMEIYESVNPEILVSVDFICPNCHSVIWGCSGWVE